MCSIRWLIRGSGSAIDSRLLSLVQSCKGVCMTAIFGDFSRQLAKNKLAVVGLIVVVILFAVALLAPYIAPCPPGDIDTANILMPPSQAHLFGTDILGRDVL